MEDRRTRQTRGIRNRESRAWKQSMETERRNDKTREEAWMQGIERKGGKSNGW